MAVRCECCGQPRTYAFTATLGAGGERIQVAMTGFADELSAYNATIKALNEQRGELRAFLARRSENND